VPMRLRRARVAGRSFAAGAQSLTHVYTVGVCGKKIEVGRRAPAGGRRVAAWLGHWAYCPSGRYGAK
jgi:hypothetical protein